MASRFGRWRRVAVAMLVLSTAGVAQAEPTAAEKETARSLMSEGRSRRERNDLPGALESFRAADALMHVTTTGLEVARSQIALGQLVEARDTLRQVMRIPAKDSDPRPFVEARANAQAMDEDLASRIPGIRIVLRGAVEGSAPGVSVDGVTVPAAALGAPFKVNPGHHVVAAVSGAARAQQQVDVAERALQTVTIELPAAAATSAGPAESTPDDVTRDEEHHGGPMRVLAIGGFGLAAAGIALGSVTGVMSLSATSRAKNDCVDNRCPPSTAGDLDTARCGRGRARRGDRRPRDRRQARRARLQRIGAGRDPAVGRPARDRGTRGVLTWFVRGPRSAPRRARCTHRSGHGCDASC
jgi:hypothetical protein